MIAPLKIGTKMLDGTIYAGVSPDNGMAMYATPTDAPLKMTFNKAKKCAAKLDVHGHQDWHLPTKAELNVLFNNRADIGAFNTFRHAHYWSSESCRQAKVATFQVFSTIEQNEQGVSNIDDPKYSVRYIRFGMQPGPELLQAAALAAIPVAVAPFLPKKPTGFNL